MWTASLRSFPGVASVFLFTLIAAALAVAADPLPAEPAPVNPLPVTQQLRASVEAPAYMALYIRPIVAEKPKAKRVVDVKFVGMSALVIGTTIADIETTQHCLGNGTCRELNPLMPHSRAGMYAVNLPVNALAMYVSYRLKARGHRTWWIAPIAISGAHAVGAGFVF